MTRQDDLVKLAISIKDADNRLNTFKAQIETIQKEIDFLSTVESQLEENITFLKHTKIVALAAEYKKAKEDLKKTKTRLSHLRSDKTNNEKAQKDVCNFVEKNKELYAKLSKQSENNVVQGKFGKKRD